MHEFILQHKSQLIVSLLLLVVLIVLRFILKTLANRVGKRQDINKARIRLMFQYINLLVAFIAVFLLFLIWGVAASKLGLVFSSVFAVIGVALFAIWSILSNITSGVILFFSFPFKIGDKIRINDKDIPIEGVIEDIKTFHLYLRDANDELITYPNNLILQKPVSLVKKNAFHESDEGKSAI